MLGNLGDDQRLSTGSRDASLRVSTSTLNTPPPLIARDAPFRVSTSTLNTPPRLIVRQVQPSTSAVIHDAQVVVADAAASVAAESLVVLSQADGAAQPTTSTVDASNIFIVPTPPRKTPPRKIAHKQIKITSILKKETDKDKAPSDSDSDN